jgi:SAM-dependent methyltransferase
MEGYDETTYGDAFADVYDDWYARISDVPTTIDTLADLARVDAGGDEPVRIVELGVGTGRLAVPLAQGHVGTITVVGVDASPAMLARLSGHDIGRLVEAIEGDMVTGLPDGPFDLAFVAYNTLFNLTGPDEQAACFRAVADRLRPGGRFVVEAFVPDDPPRDGDDVSIRTMTADRVVLSITRQSAVDSTAEGHFVELTEHHGVRLRPWSIRYRTPNQLDELAADAGLELEVRWRDMARTPFSADSDRHVSVYRSPASRPADT